MLIGRYFLWHYSKGIKNFFIIWRNFLEFCWYFFSIGVLLRTLVSPWKKDISFNNWRGFHPLLLIKKILDNIFSRLMGVCVRSVVILVGLAVEAVIIPVGLAGLLMWVLLPVVLFVSASLFVEILTQNDLDYIQKIIVGDMLFFSIWFLVLSLHGFYDSRKIDLVSRSIESLSKEKWFGRVWNRMGFTSEDEEIERCFSDQAVLEKKLNAIGLKLESLYEIIGWEIYLQKKADMEFRFWRRDRLMAITPIGKDWSFAYTVELDKYSRELPEEYATLYKDSYLMGHTRDIDMAELILSRPYQNNVFFVGEPGVGKRTLINLIAKKIREQRSNSLLRNKRLVEFDLGRLIAETPKEEQDFKITQIFQEATFAGNVILVIDNLHDFLSTGGKALSVDISSILAKYLAYPTFQVLATITSQAFHDFVERDKSIMKYVDKIIIEEPSKKETRMVMMYVLEREEKEKVLVTYQAIEEAVDLSDQYINDSPMPEKAIDMLEEAMIFWFQNSKNRFLTKDDVAEFFSQKVKVPLGKITDEERDNLVNLEEVMHKRIIGQDDAVKQISEAMRRVRSGISDQSKPIGSFLFLGPTGVGKTEAAKALAEAYFGSESKMIRLDMSEFQTMDAIERIIGSQKLNKPGQLIVKINENPFSVLLLDEIEKAYPDILNLFLQILDEGWITDAFGKKTLFKNMIIIATSNVGAEIIQESMPLGISQEEIYKQVINYAIKKGIFRPEFLNRFEKIIFFNSLKHDELQEVTKLLIKKVSERIYKKKNIKISYSENALEKIIQHGYDPMFGARSIKRFVQDKIEDVMAKRIIAGTINSGDDVELNENDL